MGLAKWKKVLLCDECTMQQFVPHHMHIRRPLGTRFDKKYYDVAAMKHPPSQMIRGCRGAACLDFILPDTIMNGPKYVELFKEKLNLHMTVHGCMIFMQHGALCHRSKYLRKNPSLYWNGPETAHDSIQSRTCGLL